MPSSRRCSAAAALLVAVAACGTDFPDRYDATCVSETVCGYFPDYASCLRGHPARTYATPLETVYHRDVAAACFRAARDFGCYRHAMAYPSGECPGAYEGRIATGGDCRESVECAGGGSCDVTGCTDACCVGTCVAPAAVLPPLPPVGASCVGFGPCEARAYCDGTVCVPRLGEGEACDPMIDRCSAGLFCMSRTCTAFGLDGDPCDATRPCEPSTERCAADGHCVALRPVGAACDDGHPCVLAAACASGTCMHLGDVGEPCTNGCYVSNQCVGDVCMPRHPAVDCP